MRFRREFRVGQRRAYQGNFDESENPSASQTIGLEMLREAGAQNLDHALDLSASVARHNNFGGLWSSFSIRGSAGDINLPSAFLVNGFNAGRGFGGPRELAGIEAVEVLLGLILAGEVSVRAGKLYLAGEVSVRSWELQHRLINHVKSSCFKHVLPSQRFISAKTSTSKRLPLTN